MINVTFIPPDSPTLPTVVAPHEAAECCAFWRLKRFPRAIWGGPGKMMAGKGWLVLGGWVFETAKYIYMYIYI